LFYFIFRQSLFFFNFISTVRQLALLKTVRQLALLESLEVILSPPFTFFLLVLDHLGIVFSGGFGWRFELGHRFGKFDECRTSFVDGGGGDEPQQSLLLGVPTHHCRLFIIIEFPLVINVGGMQRQRLLVIVDRGRYNFGELIFGKIGAFRIIYN
jgi:hypothetical protein